MDINFKLEIGWKFLYLVKLVLCFFKVGVIVVIFKILGIILVDKDVFIMLVNIGVSKLKYFFIIIVGRGLSI